METFMLLNLDTIRYSMETAVKICDANSCAWETLHLFDEVCREEACNVAAGSYLYIHR